MEEKQTNVPNTKEKGYWNNYQLCYDAAKQCKTREEFKQRFQTACKYSRENKWIDDFDWLGYKPTKSAGHWLVYENCYNAAKECKSRSGFLKKYPQAYIQSKKQGWIEKFDWFSKSKESKPAGYWRDYDHCLEVAKQCKSRSELKHRSYGAWNEALRNGWFDDYDWFEPVKGEIKEPKWNEKTCRTEALKYKTLKEFRENCLSAYNIAYRYKWLNSYDWFVEEEILPYEECVEISKKYSTLKDFRNQDYEVFNKMNKRGWIKNCDWLQKEIGIYVGLETHLSQEIDSLRNLFIDENCKYTDIPWEYSKFKEFLIKYHNFNNNDETISNVYNNYKKCLTDFWQKDKKGTVPYHYYDVLGIFSSSQWSKDFWIDRGYSEEESEKIVGDIQRRDVDYFINRYGQEEGVKKYQEFQDNRVESFKNSSETHTPMYGKYIDPSTGKPYEGERFKEFRHTMMVENSKKAIPKMAEYHQKQKELPDDHPDKKFGVFELQYWLRKGYSEEDAKKEIYNRMFHNDLDWAISKYGEEEGRRRYESRMKSFKETWDSKTEEKLKEINYKKALGCCERVSSASIKFFDKLVQRLKDEGIDKNYTYIYGFKKSDEGNTNKESNEVYIFDEKTRNWYFYDFCCVELRLIIEYNGSMFHPKPDLTEEELEKWESYKFQNKGTEQRARDLRKEEICNEMGLNFLTVWDDVKEKDNIEMVVDYIKSL